MAMSWLALLGAGLGRGITLLAHPKTKNVSDLGKPLISPEFSSSKEENGDDGTKNIGVCRLASPIAVREKTPTRLLNYIRKGQTQVVTL